MLIKIKCDFNNIIGNKNYSWSLRFYTDIMIKLDIDLSYITALVTFVKY